MGITLKNKKNKSDEPPIDKSNQYEKQLSMIKYVTGNDAYLYNLWKNYGFTLENKFVELGSNINLYEAAFIGLLLKKYIKTYAKPNRTINVLEIGLARGTSSITMLNQLIQHKGEVNYTVLDPFQTEEWKLVGLKHIQQYLRLKKSKNIHVNLVEELSQTKMPQMQANQYDIIFIDGAHKEEHVIPDLMNADILLKRNGIIICDDVLHKGVNNALKTFFKNCHGKYERIHINKSNGNYTRLAFDDMSFIYKRDYYNPGTMFAYQKIVTSAKSSPPPPPEIVNEKNKSSRDNKTFASYEDALKEAMQYMDSANINASFSAESSLPSYYNVPPEAHDSIWAMTPEAVKNTLEYIMDYLNHSCYMLCVKSNVGKIFKLEKHETAEPYKPFIQDSLLKLRNNPTLSSQNINYITRQIKDAPLRFMQCVVKQHYPGKSSFSEEYADFIEDLALPNGVYILNLTDSVILRKDGNHPFPMVVGKLDIGKYKSQKFIPIFSLSGQKGYHDIPIPNYDDVLYILGKATVNFNDFETNWKNKSEKAVFRGGPTGCGYTPETNQRLKLTTIRSKYLDIGISGKGDLINTNSIRYDPKYGIGMLNTDIKSTKQFMTMAEQSKNKYIIHIDGNVHAYRMLTTMATGSLILRVESEYTSWLDHVLRPNVHYISIKSDLSNLVEKIEYCIANDEKCQKIANAAMNIARDVLEYNKLRNIFQYIVKTVRNKNIKKSSPKLSVIRLSRSKKESSKTASLTKNIQNSKLPIDIECKNTRRCPNGRHRIKSTNICRLVSVI